ncbi:peptidase family U48, partial [Thraustotheca clavata]
MKLALTEVQAVASCLGMAVAYVGILYCTPQRIRALKRDDPLQIQTRFFLLSVVCALCPLYMLCFYQKSANDQSFLGWLGFHLDFIAVAKATALSVLLTMILFSGSIFDNFLRLQDMAKASSWQETIKQTSIYHGFCYERILAIRTYIFAPFTEEFVFRSSMAMMLLNAGFSAGTVIFVSPLAFGVAHMHHFIEHIREGRQYSQALLIVVFQFCYTSVFGIYAMFIFLRTGQFNAIFAVH